MFYLGFYMLLQCGCSVLHAADVVILLTVTLVIVL